MKLIYNNLFLYRIYSIIFIIIIIIIVIIIIRRSFELFNKHLKAVLFYKQIK